MTATSLIIHFGAAGILLPVAAAQWHRHVGDALYWVLLVLAAAGPIAWCLIQLEDGWRPGLELTLWVSVAVTMLLYVPIAAVSPPARRLALLLTPYLGLLAFSAAIWAGWEEPNDARVFSEGVPSVWLAAHILTAVLTYGLFTLAAVSGLAVYLQERALKARTPGGLTRYLPALFESEQLQTRLLTAAEAVLGIGLVTGVSTQFLMDHSLLEIDHKTLLSLAAFVVIGGLLVVQHRTGLRGRRAARYVLIGYLLLSLGFLGVRFVTDILL